MTYFFQPKPKEKIDAYKLKKAAKDFVHARDLNRLSILLNVPMWKMKSLAERPKYYQFYVPKAGGGKRHIQTPNKYLKKLQKELNFYFQAVYAEHIPPAAYGFILNYEDVEEVRNIYTNALQHIGKQWVLNVDLKDFFHSIPAKKIELLLKAPPFQFSKKAAKYLSLLCCFRGRLPMGTPTSPVLSNFVCIPLDNALTGLAQKRGWRYTRYADDMTFSCNNKFTPDYLQQIRAIVAKHQFTVNEKKLKIVAAVDQPEVTGLVLLDKPDVSKKFIEGINADIKLFHQITKKRVLDRGFFSAKAIQSLEWSIKGQINFVKFVRGEEDKSYHKLRKKLKGVDEKIQPSFLEKALLNWLG